MADKRHLSINSESVEYINIKWVKAHEELDLSLMSWQAIKDKINPAWPKKPEVIGMNPHSRMIQVHADTNLTLLRVKKVIR